MLTPCELQTPVDSGSAIEAEVQPSLFPALQHEKVHMTITNDTDQTLSVCFLWHSEWRHPLSISPGSKRSSVTNVGARWRVQHAGETVCEWQLATTSGKRPTVRLAPGNGRNVNPNRPVDLKYERDENVCDFWARYAIRCAERTKIILHFSNRTTLRRWLNQWEQPVSEDSVLNAWLTLTCQIEAMLKDIAADEQLVDCRKLVQDVLMPIRKSLHVVFEKSSVDEYGLVALRELKRQQSTLNLIEDMLFERDAGERNWLPAIDASTQKWLSAFTQMKAEEPFLNAIQQFKCIPELVTQVASDAHFRDSEDASSEQSANEMQRRWDVVQAWTRVFSTDPHDHRNARKMFEHFVVSVQDSSDSDAKSVLFKFFVDKQRSEEWTTPDSSGLLRPDAFCASLNAVRTQTEQLLHLADEGLSFDELMAIGLELKERVRPVERELKLLTDFFPLPKGDSSEKVIHDLEQTLQLCKWQEPLRRLCLKGDNDRKATLCRYEFKCSQSDDGIVSDVHFAELTSLAKQLCDPAVTRDWKIVECKERLACIRNLFFPTGVAEEERQLPQQKTLWSKADVRDKAKQMLQHASYSWIDGFFDRLGVRYGGINSSQLLTVLASMQQEAISGILYLFDYLASADKVWEFVHSHRKEYVQRTGEGYTGAFNMKAEDFLSQLGGEDAKILTNFKPVVQWVAVLVFNQQNQHSLGDFMRALWSSSKVFEQVMVPEESKPFFELKQAEDNMDWLGHLFHKGLGGLDAVLGEFTAIEKASQYTFHFTKAEMAIAFKDDRKQNIVRLDDAAVQDFEQRLGFVQHEDKAQEHNIAPYLATLQDYRRLLGVMCELHALGHPDWTGSEKVLVKGNPDGFPWLRVEDDCLLPSSKVLAVEDVLDSWTSDLEQVFSQNKLLSLFSIVVAQQLDELITKPQHVYRLALMLCPLVARSAGSFRKLLSNCQAEQQIAAPTRGIQWHARIADFLVRVLPRVELPARVGTQTQQGGPTRYTAKPSHKTLLQLLLVIFGDVPPEPYELLWCDKVTTERTLLSFIERAKHFTRRKFVLLQAEQMEPAQQHTLLRLLLRKRDDSRSSGHNLYCVETGPCVLQSASWITPRAAEEVCKDVDLDAGLRRWVFAGGCIKRSGVKCLCGPSGSGKTHQIRKRIEQLQSCGTPTCTISITEAFAVGDIARKLSEAICSANLQVTSDFAVAFHINLGKFKRSEGAEWTTLMARISKLFVRLLVLRSVEDPTNGEVFNIPPGLNLEVLVEIPDRKGHLEDSGVDCSYMTQLLAELPALVVSTEVNAAKQRLDISDDMEHVAKYLKAFQDGTIDNLYGSGGGGPKDVIFVLDDSGSMGNGPGSRIETCKQCIEHEIFNKHLQPTDRVALHLLCDHSRNVSLGLFDGAHKQSLRNNLRSVRTNRGRTPLWATMQRAVQMARGNPNAWIVALTDGGCNDDDRPIAMRVEHQLRQADCEGVRTLFITVNLPGEHSELIEKTCIRAEGDAVISANGGLDSVAQAWADVGERLTVSQQIEKAGESITPLAVEALLRKYMQLDGKHRSWSRLKQAQWVRYLHRRCGILASSEKFNKNKDLPNFGSTTMEIMLAEVDRALSDDHRVDWHTVNHTQLVYCKDIVTQADGTEAEDYKWSVLATNPEAPEFRTTLAQLETLRMHVPTVADLARDDRRVLDSYLANGLGITHRLEDRQTESSVAVDGRHTKFDFEIGRLPTIDEKQFVLTLDFVMKMLCMNERIACRVPCIMEGETGVSKTALTRMLFVLKNTEGHSTSDLQNVVCEKAAEMQNVNDMQSFSPEEVQLAVLQKLADFWGVSTQLSDTPAWGQAEQLADQMAGGSKSRDIAAELLGELRADPGLDPLKDMDEATLEGVHTMSGLASIAKLLLWYVNTRTSDAQATDWTFYPVDIHAALTPAEIANDPVLGVNTVIARSQRLQRLGELLDSDKHRKATLCIFFDEVNTSSCMGVFKELLIDHSLDGQPLPDNIVIVAACNPSRDKIELEGDRREELGNEWAIGHYQVHPLPRSLQDMTWDYGSLKPEQEWEFIRKRLMFMQQTDGLSLPEVNTLSALIYTSQTQSRDFATEHIRAVVKANQAAEHIDEAEIRARASSSVSLRDILRVFKLFSYFAKIPEGSVASTVLHEGCKTAEARRSNSMLLAVAIVYYLRLGVGKINFRKKFCGRLRAFRPPKDFRIDGKVAEMLKIRADVESVLVRCMGAIMEHTHLEPGIAKAADQAANQAAVLVGAHCEAPSREGCQG